MLSSIETKTERAGFRSLGNLESLIPLDHGVEGITSYGKFKVIVYSASVIRIMITKFNEFDDFSYAVVGRPIDVGFAFEDHDDYVLIITDKLQLKITKSPVRFTFLSKDGIVINEDDKAFGTSWIGDEVSTYKVLQKGERFIGLGEKTGGLDRRGKGFLNWNTDEFAYSEEADPLYCTIPFYMGIHSGISYGIFFDNSNKSHFNFGASNNRFASFMAEDGDMNYYFIHNDSVASIIEDYTYITGRMELPPLWSLGYQQCRYSYYPDNKVLQVAKTFRDKQIPADTIVLDIHYMDEYKIFTWHPENFADPKAMISQLEAMGFHVVVMCDPGIKIEKGYKPYDEGLEANVFLKYPDGSNYSGEVWPGWCHFPDFSKPATRLWWGEYFKTYTELGIEGFWNDMNEFATWGQMMPENIVFDYEGYQGLTKKGRNVYGLLMAKSTFEGAKSLMKGKRPFNLTRSAYSGIQRYAAVWTGDNSAEENHMLLGVRLVNSFGLSGVAFSGYDVGGFAGEASVDLFGRWLSIGAFSPFFRGHSMINSRDAEPWSFGETVEEISRNYINFRYSIMPYIYSVFFEASTTGMPVARSLAITDTHDHHIYDPQFENEYLFGPAFLVCPLLSAEKFCKVYLPEGDWYNFHNSEQYQGKQQVIVDAPVEKLPIFVKAGSIIPSQSLVQHTGDLSDETLIIHVFWGKNTSSFTYYEDDGESYAYQNDQFYKRELKFSGQNRRITFAKPSGAITSRFKEIKLILHGFESIEKVTVNEASYNLQRESFSFLKAITKFDPMEPGGSVEEKVIKTISFDNTDQIIMISW